MGERACLFAVQWIWSTQIHFQNNEIEQPVEVPNIDQIAMGTGGKSSQREPKQQQPLRVTAEQSLARARDANTF